MRKATQKQKIDFLKKQGYKVIKTTVLSEWNVSEDADEGYHQDMDTTFFPITLKKFKEHLSEITMIWTEDYEQLWHIDDIDDCLDWSDVEWEEYCKQHNLIAWDV